MEVALISDQHFGCNDFNQSQHQSFNKFYHNTFFPTLEEKNIKYIFDLGDTFDSDAQINRDLIAWSKEVYFNRIRDLGIQLFVLRGNHNPRAKVNQENKDAISIISRDYANITLIDKTTVVNISNKKFCFIPYVSHGATPAYSSKYFSEAKNSKADLFFTHLGFHGNLIYENQKSSGGFGSWLNHYLNAPVISGHYHARSVSQNFPLRYLGAPYAIDCEFRVDRGFHLFDTNSFDVHYIKNQYQALRCVLVGSLNDIDSLERLMEIKPAFCYVIPSHLDKDLMQEIEHKLSRSSLNDYKFYNSTVKLNSLLYRLISIKEYKQAKSIYNHARPNVDAFTQLNVAHIILGLGDMDKGVENLSLAIYRSREIKDESRLKEFNEMLLQISKTYLINLNC